MLSRRAWLHTGGVLTAGAAVAVGRPATARPVSPSAAGGAPLARLALNENPFGPSPSAVRALGRRAVQLARYAGAEAAEFSTLAAAREGLSVEQMVLGEVLDPLGVLLGLDGGPGGEIVYSVPGYTALVDAAARVGGVGVPVPLDPRLENDLPALRARIGPRTRALFLVNPHNPSGTVSDAVALRAFVREVAERTLVVVDEAYLDFGDDFASRTCVALTRAGANVAVFRTFSKLHALAALPFGYAAMPAPLAGRLRERGVGEPRSLDALALAAAGASLGDTRYAAVTRAKVAAERARWHEELDARAIRRTDARGNFVFFETGRPHADVAAAFLAEGVVIGRAFPPLDHWARVSIGLPDENARARAAFEKIFRRP